MIDIELDPDLVLFAHEIAVRRQRLNRNQGWTDRQQYGDTLAVDTVGALGECAACLWLGIDPRTTIAREGHDAGFDAHAHGLTWSVKTTTRRGYNFPIPLYQGFTADRAILVWPNIGDASRWTVVGAVDAATVEKHKIRHLGFHLPGWVVLWTYFEHGIQCPSAISSSPSS